MSEMTATVEVLTAEVRTLMVGSRQVTLSVYKQLDAVDPGAMEPFGRVRTSNKNLGSSDIELVGVDLSGSLVRATHTPERRTVLWLIAKAPLIVVREFGAGGVWPGSRVVSVLDHKVEIDHGADYLWVHELPQLERGHFEEDLDGDPGDSHCWTWRSESAKADGLSLLRRDAANLEAERDLDAVFDSLPLIVLAGLR